jgi:hypothetical protein
MRRALPQPLHRLRGQAAFKMKVTIREDRGHSYQLSAVSSQPPQDPDR